MSIQVLKVSGNSNINAVADTINKYVDEYGIVHIDAIGVKTTYMTVKALIQAVEYLVSKGYRFNLRPYYVKVNTAGNDIQPISKTAIRWTLIAKGK
ncbi:stage V sporulation protein S [Clostridium thermosuccinogenes]|uniref:Stage V sporulation protein S n=1 Tax=Clostridium thermosuccinogenes TaxID=84032 RepID=A0A2K2EZ60_9CLOT|nr:stage V sporulation protein S [Pseudoclostridium thermosuccinogenes]AUS95455.1 stage V sporulation protein S [Pseudoclostridium thermosuccinogenes]PNT91797.1 stage V sporulation protein S [Pseudoclostridium thermosuccinogenes]PNT94522.1 stage V sporulation protein S [Pseudoclostridium thermosuccinogenes]